jgi:hypothetical protein
VIANVAARVDRWFYGPAPAERLAALRILVGGFGVGYLIIRWPNLVSYATFDSRRFEPVGVMSLLGEPLAGDIARLLVAGAVLSGVAFVCGWRHRITGPLFAILLLWVLTYRNSFGQIFHTENLLVLHTLVLAFAPAADAWSLDAHGKPAPPPDARYGWPIQLMCVVTVLAYFISGETKLRNAGLDWLEGDNLRNYVAYDNLRKAELGDSYSPLAEWLLPHAWIFTPLAMFTLVVELGAPLALVGRGVGRAWVACAWLFHIGILALMAIVFPYPLLCVAFAAFFEVEKVRLHSLSAVTRRVRGFSGG